MKQETQIAQIERILELLDSRTTELTDEIYLNPVSTYTSSDQFELEKEVFFRHSPLIFCHSSQIPNPGDFFTDELTGVPVLIVRGKDGVARAMINVCRHRGARLVQGSGHCERAFMCPYHAWTYNYEGHLRMAAPKSAFPDIAAEDRNLVPLPCAERHGFIWVRPSPGGPIDESGLLGSMDEEIMSYGFDSYVHHDTRRVTKAMNWKLVIDTFMETWHIGTLHRETVASIFPGISVFDSFETNGRVILPRRSLADLRNLPRDQWELLSRTAIIYTVLPNSLLVWQGDHLEIWRSFPGAHAGECIAEASLYIPKPVESPREKRYWDKNMDLLMATVEGEDFPVCEDIQRSCSSGAQTHLTLGRNEPALIHFHKKVQTLLKAAAVSEQG